MPMTDEEKEKRAEERRLRLQGERIGNVWTALSKTKGKTSRELSDETGYSVPLVRSTINLIRRETETVAGPTRDADAVTYDPKTGEYWIARTWPEQRLFIEWLRKHLTTRSRNLATFTEVAVGLWPGEVPLNMQKGLLRLEVAVEMLEDAAEAEAEKASLSAHRAPKLHG